MDSSAASKGIGTWHRYKLGQAQFTSWLKKTAEKLTAATPAEAQPEPGKPSRRQKKKMQADPSLAVIKIDAEAKSLHWSQLEVLAQRVVDHARPDEIPAAAIHILRDVVSLRKKSYRFFSGALKNSDDEKTKHSNASHAHIIGVLERVLAKLEALVSTKAQKTKTNESAPLDISQLGNMFSFLEVEPATEEDAGDIDDDIDDGTARGKRTKPGKRSRGGKKKAAKKPKKGEKSFRQLAKMAADNSWMEEFDLDDSDWEDEEDDEFDLYMMLYCFFVDFNDIRNYVRERWCDYWYDRSVSLDTLAVITNAAFELFHKLELGLKRRLDHLHPELTEYEFMMELLFIEYGLEHIDYDDLDKLSPQEKDERIWRDEADWLAFGSYATANRMLRIVHPNQVPTIPPSQKTPIKYGADDTESWDKFQMSVCFELVGEMASLVTMKKHDMVPGFMPAEPQLYLDLQNMLRQRRYSSALVFSLHLWTDIRNIIEHDVVRPLEQLQQTAARVKDGLDKHDPRKVNEAREAGEFKKEWSARIEELQEFMLGDFTLELKTSRFRQVGIHDENPTEFTLFKYDPVWPGLLDFRARIAESQMAHQFTMLTCVLEAAAYLYHAALATGVDVPGWGMMDKYVNTYNRNSKFRRGLVAGQSATTIINNFQGVMNTYHRFRKISRTTETTDGGNTFSSAVKIRMTLYDRYCFDYEGNLERLDYIDDIINHQLLDDQEMGPDLSCGETAMVEHTGDQDKLIRRQAALFRLSPVETLQLLDRTVTSQLEGILTLDYFGLYDKANALLGTVSDNFKTRLSVLGYDDSDRPGCFASMVVGLGQILRGAAKEVEKETLNTLVEIFRSHLSGERKPR